MERHTFAVCAYKDSPYLEECIKSLKRQSVPSEIIVCTSTPSEYIREMAERYDLPLYVREGKSDIQDDWNFACEKASGRLVTIAHQDDCYHRDYAKWVQDCWENYPDTTVFTTDCLIVKERKFGAEHDEARKADESQRSGEVRKPGDELQRSGEVRKPGDESQRSGEVQKPDEVQKSGRMQKADESQRSGEVQKPGLVQFVKMILRLPLRFRKYADRTWVKKAALVFGNPIICPSCTYDKEALGVPLFDSEYKFALDWDTMWKLAERPGRFVCVERPLIRYRIHEEATTKACIKDHRRSQEEAAMYGKIWPKSVVKVLMFFYKRAYAAYD